jgi:YVTN family beta-propeller protein
VSNFHSNTISSYTISPLTGALTAIPGSPFTATSADFVTVDPSGKYVYVVDLSGSTISVFTMNPTTGTLAAIAGSPFAAGSVPNSMAITPSVVRAVYITNEGSKTVSVINASANTVVATVKVGPNPVDAALTPNGATAYITNAGEDTVSVINTATNSLLATLKVGWHPVDAAVTPDGSSVYVTNAGSDSVSVINTASNTVVATIPVGNEFPVHFRWSFFDRWRRPDPVHVAISPDGTRAYVTNAGSDNVSVINTATHAVKATVKVGRNPLDVAVTPDGAKAYVTNAGSNSVSVIDTSTNAVSATVPVGVHPVDAAVF